ncbi:hypothetical protein DFH28DRAFT_1119017 [Melampsora americana]|nr:hypothetical protein DFH28DRAFT_1119017 [Melampsora americana]
MSHFHSSFSHSEPHRHQKRDSSICQTYLSPAASDVIEAYAQTTLKWDPKCLTTYDSLDIYLQSVDAAQPIHLWKSVTTSDGQLTTSFIPSWWNSTNAATLQLVITGADQPAWAGSGSGPTFFAEFNGTTPDSVPDAEKAKTQSGGPSVEVINKAHSRGLAGGSIAAAVLVPLLAVAGLIAAYIVISRRRSGAASKRWSQFVDQRMSSATNVASWEAGRLPTDPVIPRPDSARVASMYRHSASLPSRASFVANTPTRLSHAFSPEMSQHRKSTVSFADSPLPPRSAKSSLSIKTSPVQPNDTPVELILSPTQERGPSALGRVGVNAKAFTKSTASTSSANRNPSNLRFEVGSAGEPSGPAEPMPTFSRKQAVSSGDATNPATLFNNPFWQSSQESQASSQSTGMSAGMRRISNLSALSPDEALRQYSIKGKQGNSTGSGGMRVLYSPHAADATSQAPSERSGKSAPSQGSH